jgi:uncharacterized membrane protein/thiol-disulfide isomerase/thioredoxin
VKKINVFLSLLLVASLFFVYPVQAQTTDAVVYAVLFYSPSCGHCHYVIDEVFPPLFEKYGNQLQIAGVDVTQPDGQALFLEALNKFGVERGGVPFLVMGDIYLIGSAEIPEQFPGLIEKHLAQGGLDWPDIPGLRETLGIVSTPTPAVAPQAGPEPVATTQAVSPSLTLPDSTNITWQEKFARDPAGNSLAVLILVMMLAAVVWAVNEFRKVRKTKTPLQWTWTIPILCLFGFGVAGYLAYVETANVTAVCGPVGDCNTVQQSAYARLFGLLPIGVLGLMGYIALAIAWLLARYTKGKISHWSSVAMLAFSFGGTLFSIYLTFLEPFVIGATCAWCLTSAVLITLIMLFSLRHAKFGFEKLKLI